MINVDTYVEAALEETKLVKGTASRQRTPGQVAGKAVVVGHLQYVSHVPNRGHFNCFLQHILPNSPIKVSPCMEKSK